MKKINQRYKSIVFWPFPDDATMLTFPIWKIADENCNLVIESSLDRLKETYNLLDFWGFRHCKTFMRWGKAKTYFVVGAKGDPPEISFGKHIRTPYSALSLLPGPRLAINSARYKPGWINWSEDRFNKEDIFSYPIRKDYVRIDPQILFLVYLIQKYTVESKQWRWRIGDCIKLMIEGGISTNNAIDFVSELTGYSRVAVRDMINVAKAVPESQRNYDRTWGSYRKELRLWSRSHEERQQRSTTMGRYRSGRAKKAV